MKIEPSNCRCHVETCNCWRWYITLNGKRLYGSDDRAKCEETLKEIKEACRE